MPQRKDDTRREAIKAEAKRCFAEHGYEAVSISDIVRELKMPVGSVYTYFRSKQDLLLAILDEGWDDFRNELEASLAEAKDAAGALSLILYRTLPALFTDADFITIALNEAGRSFPLADKLAWLSERIRALVQGLGLERGLALRLDTRLSGAALAVYLLGSLETIRLARREQLALDEQDVLAFIRLSVQNAVGPLPQPDDTSGPH